MYFKSSLVYLSLITLFIVSCGQSNNESSKNVNTGNESSSDDKKAHIKFETDKHDFGDVIQGEKVFYSFNFTNSGEADLVISLARGSCGCTVPTYPRKPIKPGEKGQIDVVFDSENLRGISEKTVTVMSNSYPEGIEILTIRVNVIPTND